LLAPSVKSNCSADYTRGAFFWHIDGANDPAPAKATMLSVRTLPAAHEGGDTLVANTYAAYRRALPDEEKMALQRISDGAVTLPRPIRWSGTTVMTTLLGHEREQSPLRRTTGHSLAKRRGWGGAGRPWPS